MLAKTRTFVKRGLIRQCVRLIVRGPVRRFVRRRRSHLIPTDSGVIHDRCYGCGRCLPICPYGLIEARSQPTSLDAIAHQVLSQANALEIHTQVGQLSAFTHLWQTIEPQASQLQLVSISCPDDKNLIPYLKELQRIMGASASTFKPALVWQTDGRPMSGDIGKGTTHAAIRIAQKVLAADLPGYVQLAGWNQPVHAYKT